VWRTRAVFHGEGEWCTGISIEDFSAGFTVNRERKAEGICKKLKTEEGKENAG
jgi:hypothetical protein